MGSVVVLSGCMAGTYQPVGPGILYTETIAPVMATSNSAGSKTGRACAESFLGWITRGDASITAAQKNGNIKTISSVNLENESILSIYAKSCTVVSGY